ncbi:MAG: hypothetical protein LBD94_01350 [Rickettsiales bacterium]|jgi:hypothetical protein|nr:hypothetical protein [Rickettsiales bacterium]
MKTRSVVIAQKLMNLYRNAFAIDGGWRAVNSIFVAEADDLIISEIEKLPCGKNLVQHIRNLKNGRTKMDSIDTELMPYNGMMQPQSDDFNKKDFDALRVSLENFQPNAESIERIKSLPIVQSFGDRWRAGIRAILKDDSLIEIWRTVLQAESALRLWGRAAEILSSSPSDLLRAEVQADMPEYETYLPMFGKDGLDVLSELRKFVL